MKQRHNRKNNIFELNKKVNYRNSKINSIFIIIGLMFFIGLFLLLFISKYYILSIVFLSVFIYLSYITPLSIVVFDKHIICKYLLFKTKKYDFLEIKFIKFSYGGKGAYRILLIQLNNGNKIIIDEKDLSQVVSILNLFLKNQIKIIQDEFWISRIIMENKQYKLNKI